MRKPLIAGNWKMNTDLNEGSLLTENIVNTCGNIENVEIVLCPPFTHLATVSNKIENTKIKLGAQNMYWEKDGAFTGEISADMLKSVGCSHAIIGHSERRELFRESNENVNKKVLAALGEGLIPILAVGETLLEREENKTETKIKNQIETALVNIENINLHGDTPSSCLPAGTAQGMSGITIEDIIVAYEPIWAIGTGKTASPQQANEVISYIRSILSSLYTQEQADKTRILYGGSVNAENIDVLMAESDIDGALVGGASLDSKSFERIIKFKP